MVEPMSVVIHKISVGDLEFDVRISGPESGPPVLLLHGFPTVGTQFDSVIPRLHESGLRTIVPDQRGYSPGARPMDVDSYRVEHLVADALGILDALEIPHVLLVGHDWGAIVGWHLAVKHPKRINGYVAVSVGHPSATASALADGTEQREKSSYIKDFLQPNYEDILLADNRLRNLVPDSSVEPLLEKSALTAALNWYRANFNHEARESLKLGPVEIPTTLIWGEDDSALGRLQAERTGRFVYGDYRFSALPGVGHWIPTDAPEALAAEIALRSVRW